MHLVAGIRKELKAGKRHGKPWNSKYCGFGTTVLLLLLLLLPLQLWRPARYSDVGVHGWPGMRWPRQSTRLCLATWSAASTQP